MYLLYSDLCGPLADYSLNSDAPHTDAALPCEDVSAAGIAAADASSQWTSLLRATRSLWLADGKWNYTAPGAADMFEGERP
ncbi:hypothetical protein B0G76_5583 [Paraburkholderia sp. BL23I1N1]|nr:hypothetical protein B0G76_5583 [Paraburkholderia sp. BL23I1N1]